MYGNFVNRALVLTHKYFDGKVPACGELNDYDRETLKEFADVKEEVEKLLNVFKFRDAQIQNHGNWLKPTWHVWLPS